MQSDGNSFCGDVVLDSFNMSSREKDNILYQCTYKNKFDRNIITIILSLHNIKQNTYQQNR